MTHGAEGETHVRAEGLLQVAEGEDGPIPAPETVRRSSGDDAVDQVLERFDAVADESLDTQIDAGEQVHRVLLGRLADLGKE
jgi:hypothetical protein